MPSHIIRFLVLCKGSKTSKLSYAFGALDEANKGGLR